MVVLKNQLLIAFEKIAEFKTVHAAAKDLGLTQAAVTKRLRQLESEMQVSLFLRSRRGMTLTDEGRALLLYCKSIHESEGQLLSVLQGTGDANISLTLAGPTSAISTRIVKDILPIYKKYSFLKLHLRSEDHANLIDWIRQGRIDLAVVAPDLVPNEMDSKKLKADRYWLVGSPRWRERPLKDIILTERIIDFYESDKTTINYLKKYSLDKSNRPDRLFVNENEAMIQLLKAEVGYATLTENIAESYIKSGELIKIHQGQVYEDELALVWYPRLNKTKYFHDLIRAIK